jgi:hypothetical protein
LELARIAAMMASASDTSMAEVSTTALGRRSKNTFLRSLPGVRASTIPKPATTTTMPTRKYSTVLTTLCNSTLASTVPNWTSARFIPWVMGTSCG